MKATLRRVFVALFQRLLVLCQRLGRQSFQCLLRLYSALLRRITPDIRCSGTGDESSYSGSNRATLPKFFYSSPDSTQCDSLTGSSAIVAYSSVPTTPPRALTYQRHVSTDSCNTTPLSPTSTLHDSPGTISDSKAGKGKASHPMGFGILAQGSSQPNGAFTAEPAKLVAPPIKHIRCTFPSIAPRYDRKIPIKSEHGPFTFAPLQTLEVHKDHYIPDWILYVQPEGQPYFYNDKGSSTQTFSYLTEANLFNAGILAEVNLFVERFEHKAHQLSESHLPSKVDVVLEIGEKDWLYYMVDLDRRCVFWIDECVIDEYIMPPNFGVERSEHLRHLLDFEFWQHVEYFPSHRPLLDGVLDELMGILIHSHIDVITSLTSTAAYDDQELQALMGSVKHLQVLQESARASSYVVTASARLMALFANERFYNFSGFHGARLSLDQSVRGESETSHSWLIKSLSPVLFYSPETHLLGLQRLWVDGVIKARHWKKFQSRLERDWEGFVLYSTVLLNANVAFLAIAVVLSNNNGLLFSPAAVASQVSMIASLGSIIIGLLLVRQLRISARESANDAIAYLEHRTHPQLGLETMAILYSLPFALLMWGMITFLTAVAIMCFYDADGNSTLVTRLIYGVPWVFVVLLISWTVLTGWETTQRVNWRSLIPSFDAREAWRRWRKRDSGEEEVADESDGGLELEDIDSRSIRSSHSVRSNITVTGRKWRSRVRKLTEGPRRRLTWKKPSFRDQNELTPTSSRFSYLDERPS
ncbi:hypothetical protein M0805_001243 [Coniferiporia weirii]|nr:hypothetical protein M0805_001243 [Coniferiporia weirii]